MIRRRTILLAALVAIVAAVVLGAAGLVMLPGLVRRAAVWRLETLTNRRVTIDRVDLNVFSGNVAVRGLRIADRDEPADLVRVEQIKARVHRRSLLELHVWIDDLVVERSSVRIVRLSSTRFNISDLLDRPTRPPSGVGITIDRLRVTEGSVVLEDRTLRPARTWKSERIDIEARNLSTTRSDGSGQGSTIVAGAPVHVRVEDVRLVPIHVRAHVTVANVDLGLLRLYLPGDAVVLPERGVLSAGIGIVHDAREGTVISAGARIRQLALERRGQSAPVATSPETVVTLNDLHLKGGGFSVGRAEIEGDVDVTEALVGPPVTYAFRGTRLIAETLTWPDARPGRVTFGSSVPGGGRIDVSGTVQLSPLRTDAQVKLAGVDLAAANRYTATAGTLAGVGDVDARVLASWDRALRLAITGTVGASRLAVTDSRAPAAPPVLTAERVEATGIDYEWPARLTLTSLRARRPSAVVERDAAGAVTLPELFARQKPTGEGDVPRYAGRVPEISVGELRVDDGAVTVVDNTVTPAARVRLASIAVSLRDATWPIRGPMPTEVSAALGGGGQLNLSGIVDVDEQRTRSKLTLKNVDLTQAQPFLPFRGRVSGRVDANLDVRGRLDPFRLRLRGDVVLSEAAVEDRDQPLLAVERVGLTAVDFRWPTRLSIDELSVRRPWAKITRNERGELTLRAAFLARPGLGVGIGGGGAGQGAQSTPPEVAINRVLVEEGATSVIDDSVEPAARFEVRGTRLQARNITYPVKTPAQVTLATPMPEGGRLEGRGTFELDPGRMALRAKLSGVALAPAQPYLPIEGRVTGVIDGDVRIAGTFEPLALTVRGNATIGSLSLGDGRRELLTAGRALAQGVAVDWPGRVRVDTVEVDKPWLLLERDTNGRLALLPLLTPRVSMTPRPRSDDGAQPRTPLRVDVGTARVVDGFGRFVDRVPEPDFAEELSAVNATVTGFSTAPGSVARATVRATVGPNTALAVSGEMTPPTGPRQYDVLVTVDGYPAPRANPYLQTLFGWRARQGTITVAAHYVVKGDELEATNDVGMSGLVVERAPGGSEAPRWPIGLPLDTFVSLLKNREGDAQLSVPIHGTLSSPKFEVGDAIATALRGIVVKTVTLPFSLVGRVFADEKERIESLHVNPVLFEAGTATAAAGMAEHVEKLAVFLRDKPAVRLMVRPVMSVEDVSRLKRTALRERVRAAAGERTPTAMQDALTTLYVEKFPRRAPAAVDEMIAALAEYDPAPTAATRALAERRVQSVRDALGARGVDASRMPVIDTAPAVEAEGAGRVEFEITQ